MLGIKNRDYVFGVCVIFFHALSIEMFQSVLSLQGSSLPLCLLYAFCWKAPVSVNNLYLSLSRGWAFVQVLVFNQHLSGLSICCGEKLEHLWVSCPPSWCRGGCRPWLWGWTVNTNCVLCCVCTAVSTKSHGWLYFRCSTVFCRFSGIALQLQSSGQRGRSTWDLSCPDSYLMLMRSHLSSLWK